jgi:hypothetical protein
MSEVWYYAREGKPAGPVSLSQLKAELHTKPNWKEELVWQVGTKDWVLAGSIPELAVTPPPLPAKHPASASSSAAPEPRKPTSRVRKAAISAVSLLAVVIAAAIGGTIGREAVRSFNRPSQQELDAALQRGLSQAAEQLRPTLPQKLDERTTMVGASADGFVLTYSYVVDETRALVTSSFTQDTRKHVREQACKSVMVKSMQHGARYRYTYRDTKGRHLGTFELTHADCV